MKKVSLVSPSTKIKRNTEIVHRLVGDVLYTFDEKSLLMNTYNDVAVFIWKQLTQPKTITELVKLVENSYEIDHETALKDVYEFIASELGEDKLFLS